MEVSKPRPRRSFAVWIPETLALVISALCLGVLVAVLAVYNGRPIVTWKGITLNTIVSVLSTASKAMLMMMLGECISQWKWILFANESRHLIDFMHIDDASRGPLGSLKAMWHCRGATILRLGALTTLLAIAVDPFAQQILQYRQELDFVASADTTVARALRYSKGNQVNQAIMLDPSRNPPIANTMADADFSMQSAILYGLAQSHDNTVKQLPFNCPSGNCTWPAYESLSVCSRCNDLTSSLSQLSDRGVQPALLMVNNDAAVAGNGTAFRLPNGVFIDNLDGWKWGTSKNGAMLMTTYGTGNASNTNSMQDLDTLIWAISVLKVVAPSDNATAWPNLAVSATECALYYCVTEHTTSVRNGTLHDDSAPVPSATRVADSWQPTDFPAAFKPLNATMRASIDFDDRFSCIARSDLALRSPATGALFNASWHAVDGVSASFKTTFETPLQRFNETNGTVDGSVNGWYMNASSSVQYSPSAIAPLYASADLNATFGTLALSMSNALRAGADGGGTQVLGETGVVVTRYRTVWAWLALHCGVVLMGAVFLAATVRESGSVAAPVWKSSTLAVMSRGGHVVDVLGGVECSEGMAERARSRKAVLFEGHI